MVLSVINFLFLKMKKYLFENYVLKLLSLALAFILWIFVSQQGTIREEIVRDVYIEYINMPDNLIKISDHIESIQVSIDGPSRVIRKINFKDLKYVINLSGCVPGPNFFKIYGDRIQGLPSKKVNITSIRPSQVTIYFEKALKKEVNISAKIIGKPFEGYEITKVSVEPSKVTIIGPENEVYSRKEIYTEPIDISGERKSLTKEVVFDITNTHIIVIGIKKVNVSVEILPQYMEREFSVPLTIFTNESNEVKCEPESIKIVLKGNYSFIKDLSVDKLELYIDLSYKEPSIYKVKPTLTYPIGVELLSEIPIVTCNVKEKLYETPYYDSKGKIYENQIDDTF